MTTCQFRNALDLDSCVHYSDAQEAAEREALKTAQNAAQKPFIYKIFDYAEERENLFQISKAIAEHLHRNSIRNLVIVDRSSRPLYVGVLTYWRQKWPNDTSPDIFLVNPIGFVAKEDLNQRRINDFIAEQIQRGDNLGKYDDVRSREEVDGEFQRVYRRLYQRREEVILLFDTCIHSGDSLRPILRSFDRLDFSKVIVGTIEKTSASAQTDIPVSFWITSSRPEKGCYPFDRDRLIEKMFGSVFSRRSNDIERRRKSVGIRREIRQTVLLHPQMSE